MLFLDVLGALLLVATPMSYIPQYVRVLKLRSSVGISLSASFLIALAAQIQLVTMYYTFRNHSDTKYGSIFATPPAVRDWLVLAQIVVQWACSLLLLGLVVAFDTDPASDSPRDSTTDPAPSRRNLISGATAIILILLNAILSVAFALVAGKPLARLGNIAFLVIMSFCTDIAIPFATIITVAAFAFQASVSSRMTADVSLSPASKSSSLSKQALTLQLVTLFILAIMWPFRIQLPSNLGSPDQGWEWILCEWYPNVGWPCVNNAISAVGHYIVLYHLAGGNACGTQSPRQERLALLR